MQMANRRKVQKFRPEIAIGQFTLTIVLGLLLFFAASAVVVVIYQLTSLGTVYPGVSVEGVEVSGLTADQVFERILERLNYPQSGHILLLEGERQWLAAPDDLGLFMDVETGAEKAFAVGRSGGIVQRLWDQYRAYTSGIDINPVYLINQNLVYQVLLAIATEIDRPVIEPSLSINGTEVVVHEGQTGRQVNIAATMDAVTAQLSTLSDGIVRLTVDEQPPIIVDVSQQAELARRIISQPLTLSLPAGETSEARPWVFEPQSLASMLSFDHVQTDGKNEYQVTLNSQMLYDFLLSLQPSLYRQSVNARFIFNDETRLLEVIQPAVIGRDLNAEGSIQTIRKKLIEGAHDINLEITYSPPPATDTMSGSELGIIELVHEETSFFYGSSAERVQNIKAAASRFHGLLIAPGETFSMAQALGDISLDNGYAEALIILGGQTIKGVGGGVCQVSTTLFRAAFFTGFPILERHSHAYRVSYYEKVAGNRRDPNLAGLDATVFVPLVDLKFQNDTPNWLLMETYVNPTYSSIVWKFYSTADGRQVEWDTTGPVNVVEAPKTLYRENPELPGGEVKQVDWSADGADVTVMRRVYRDGGLLFEDSFVTHYQPWQAIFEYGPGTEGMPPPEDQQM